MDLNAALPFSPVMGRYNPLAPPLQVSLEAERIVGRVRLQEAHQGLPGLVHGGVLSAIFGEVLAMATLMAGRPGTVANLNVEFFEPVPLFEELRFEAWIERVGRRRVEAHGKCRLGSDLLAEARGSFHGSLPAGGWIRRGVASASG